MAPRDRISEIVEIRKRSVRHVPSMTKFDLDRLTEVWRRQLKDVDFADELVPIQRLLRFWRCLCVGGLRIWLIRALRMSSAPQNLISA